MATLKEQVVAAQNKLVKEHNLLVILLGYMADEPFIQARASSGAMETERVRLKRLITAYTRALDYIPPDEPAV